MHFSLPLFLLEKAILNLQVLVISFKRFALAAMVDQTILGFPSTTLQPNFKSGGVVLGIGRYLKPNLLGK